MDGPKIIMLSEISQGKTSTVCFHLYVESKQKKTKEQNRNRLAGAESKLVVISGERSRGRGKIEEGDLEVQTTRFKLSKIPEYTVPHSKYSQYFIITLCET